MTLDTSWTLAPAVLVALPAYLVVYAARWWKVRARGGPRAASGWRFAAFAGGVLAMFIALISPVDRLGEQMFFWHMVQHILLLDLAPILLIVGLTKVLLRPITARLQRLERAVGPLAHPVTAMALYAGTLWIWHIPALYESALRDPIVHAFQHTTLLTVGVLFWWHVFGAVRPRRAVRGLGVIAYMAGTKFLTGLLASAITFAPRGTFFYDFYGAQPRMWGLTAAEDQNLAGALMMTEELFVMTSAFAYMFVRMLSDSERDEQRAERFGQAR